MTAFLGGVVIYTKRVEAMTAFYCTHFSFEALHLEGDRIVELMSPGDGANIYLHPVGEGRKEGQTLVKLSFAVADVPAFCEAAKANGLTFGPLHQADGYCFANAKDPAKNSVTVSSRAFRKTAQDPDAGW